MNQSQLNNSLAKQLYSFSKAERFPHTAESPCKERFYDYKLDTITNRWTSFGYGNKTDLAANDNVPPPGNYQSIGQFDANKSRRRGYSFSGNSNRSIVNEQEVAKMPGPGKYETDKDVKFSQIKYSFRPKFQSIFQKSQHDLGPGQYNTIEVINKEGRHSLAKYPNSRCRSFMRTQRFQEIRVRTPGPGAYKDDQKLSLNKTGNYFNSKFKNNSTNVFGKSRRPSLGPKTLSPGPGKYDTFSQFNSTCQ